MDERASPFEAILPREAVVAEAFAPDWSTKPFRGEEEFVLSSVRARRDEFAAARNCARRTLAALGREPVAIGRGAYGEPLFPDGILGSITHSNGYCAAALIEREHAMMIGIDVERAGALSMDVRQHCFSQVENELIDCLDRYNREIAWGAAFFSAKEAYFKAAFPRVGYVFDFHDVELCCVDDIQAFSIRIIARKLQQVLGGATLNLAFKQTDERIFAAATIISG